MTFIFIFLVLIVAFVFFRKTHIGHLNPLSAKQIIDSHVHIAGLGYGDSACFINEKMRNNFRFPFYLWSMGVTEKQLKQYGDQFLIQQLSARIAQSESVEKAIILAMDAYIDDQGEMNRQATQIYIPNDYVKQQTARYDNLLFGASVNPNRKDALERLAQVKRQGAVLIKWIPSIMNIDPANPAYIPFYKKMVQLNIPLLTHTGMEKSFTSSCDELADPKRLILPLECGVTIIGAHIATTGKTDGEENFTRILPMVRQYKNLFVDISSLTQINKLNYLGRALKEPGISEKMLYGTDWPLQFFPLISPWYHIKYMTLKQALIIGGIKNQWDRDVALKVAIGVPKEVFQRGRQVFALD